MSSLVQERPTLEPEARAPKHDIDRKVRVLRLFSRLNVGGPAIHVILATEGLDPNRYDSLLVVGREGEREGSFEEYARSRAIPLEVLPSFGRSIHPIRDLVTFFTLLRMMRRLRPDVVHTHTAKAGALGRLAARLTGVPVVVHTFHGSVFDGYFGPLASHLCVVAERILAKLSDRVIAVSPKVAEELGRRRVADAEKIEVIRLGLELERFARTPRGLGGFRRELGIHRSVPLVGCVGRLVPIKDIPTVLSALEELSARLPGARLVLVGDGSERHALERSGRERGLAERVHFLGFRSDLEGIYSDLDLVVNASLNEGTPVALIEAMAAGAPVLATAVGGTPDLLEDGRLGRLVPPQDPGALASGAEEILTGRRDTRATVERARASVLRRFDARRLFADLDGLYGRLLRKHSRPALRRSAADPPTL